MLAIISKTPIDKSIYKLNILKLNRSCNVLYYSCKNYTTKNYQHILNSTSTTYSRQQLLWDIYFSSYLAIFQLFTDLSTNCLIYNMLEQEFIHRKQLHHISQRQSKICLCVTADKCHWNSRKSFVTRCRFCHAFWSSSSWGFRLCKLLFDDVYGWMDLFVEMVVR